MLEKLVKEYQGTMMFDDLHHLSSDKTVQEQVSYLKEDLLQAHFIHNYILDIGWYPSFSGNGAFQILLIKAGNWDMPIFHKKTAHLTELLHFSHEALKEMIKE
ncbi:hypothetical protein [Isobaculum melis]|uniref:Uncharacterized protein n=1 Tax=Isobaculum melis TaxID=142588 RepID=A0A1H9RW38_9LACT|nr:hypothetical protein [Isobaculum melis]SER76854.1 hypothetical protein SAMN04488559_105123 [Isobaculum melis]